MFIKKLISVSVLTFAVGVGGTDAPPMTGDAIALGDDEGDEGDEDPTDPEDPAGGEIELSQSGDAACAGVNS